MLIEKTKLMTNNVDGIITELEIKLNGQKLEAVIDFGLSTN